MDETYVGLLAVTAMTRSASHTDAWAIAREVAAEIPSDLEAATLEASRRADRAMWPHGVS